MRNVIYESVIARRILFNIRFNKVNYSSKVALNLKIPTSYSNTMITRLCGMNLLKRAEFKDRKKRDNKMKYYELTEKGERVFQLLSHINEELK